ETHYIDVDVERLALAESIGAVVAESPAPRRHGRHLVTVDASASVAGLHCALRSTAGDGICTSVGIYYGGIVEMPLLEMYTNNITFITGRVSARPAIPYVLELVAGKRFAPERVTTTVAAWDDAPA